MRQHANGVKGKAGAVIAKFPVANGARNELQMFEQLVYAFLGGGGGVANVMRPLSQMHPGKQLIRQRLRSIDVFP